MPSDRLHRVLNEPISVGLKVMPNRLYRPPGGGCGHGSGTNGAIPALPEWGTVVSGPWTVFAGGARDDRGGPWDAGARSAVEQTCHRAHARGALAGLALRCASPPSTGSGDLLRAVGDVARGARAAGCDIVSVGAGSERSLSEIVEHLAFSLGDDCAIGVEMDAIAELPIIEFVDEAVDFWVCALGDNDAERIRRARTHTTKPIVGIGRFGGEERMVAAIRSGQLDVVGPLDHRLGATPP